MNTLKEKFSEIIICTEIEGCSKQSDDCVKIADDFAVEFLRWFTINNYKHQGNSFEEYLRIFKIEQGL